MNRFSAVSDLSIRPSQIDPSAPIPLYKQIYTLLRQKIEDGEIAFNAKLPAEESLAASLGVSRITAKRAMNELATYGLVTRYRGRGTIVSHNSSTPMIRGGFTTPMEHLRRMGFSTEITLNNVEILEANEEVARELFIPMKTPVQRVERVRHLEGAPFSFIVNYTPMQIAKNVDEADLATRPFTALLAEVGHPVVSADQTILAQSANGIIARNLLLGEGVAVLTVRRILRDKAGRAVQFSITNYRADRYQYHMTMSDLETLTPSE